MKEEMRKMATSRKLNGEKNEGEDDV